MNIFDLCEAEAIQFFGESGVDISSKEKRVELDENTKKEVFDFLVQRFFAYQFSF